MVGPLPVAFLATALWGGGSLLTGAIAGAVLGLTISVEVGQASMPRSRR